MAATMIIDGSLCGTFKAKWQCIVMLLSPRNVVPAVQTGTDRLTAAYLSIKDVPKAVPIFH